MWKGLIILICPKKFGNRSHRRQTAVLSPAAVKSWRGVSSRFCLLKIIKISSFLTELYYYLKTKAVIYSRFCPLLCTIYDEYLLVFIDEPKCGFWGMFLAWDVIYTSRAYATMSVSVCLSVTEVHWRIIANLGFKFRSHFTAHCGRGRAACGRIISRHAIQC